MTTLLAKTHIIPIIAAMRTTVAGDQYTVETPEYVDIVTVTDTHITCTCHDAHCSHIQAVERRRAADMVQATIRSAYHLLFDLSYGDTVA